MQTRPAVFFLSVRTHAGLSAGPAAAANIRLALPRELYHHGPLRGPLRGARLMRMCTIVWVLSRSRIWLR